MTKQSVAIEPKQPEPPAPTRQDVQQAISTGPVIRSPLVIDALANIYEFILKRKAEKKQP